MNWSRLVRSGLTTFTGWVQPSLSARPYEGGAGASAAPGDGDSACSSTRQVWRSTISTGIWLKDMALREAQRVDAHIRDSDAALFGGDEFAGCSRPASVPNRRSARRTHPGGGLRNAAGSLARHHAAFTVSIGVAGITLIATSPISKRPQSVCFFEVTPPRTAPSSGVETGSTVDSAAAPGFFTSLPSAGCAWSGLAATWLTFLMRSFRHL